MLGTADANMVFRKDQGTSNKAKLTVLIGRKFLILAKNTWMFPERQKYVYGLVMNISEE